MIQNKKYYVDQINSSKANQFTKCWHYSGTGFKKAKINLGIFRKSDNLLVGVLQWGVSAQEGIKLNRYVKEQILKEQYLELNRFCMADSEEKNSESQAISLGIKWIKANKPDIRLLVSYAGRKEGNYGYIYQATNWEYLGYFISPGFWQVDGKEKHQLTLWHTYKTKCDQMKSFKEGLCEYFNQVIQTWTKQFIYIKRLDRKLTPASEVLEYPKPSNNFPICVRTEVYKDEPFSVSNKNNCDAVQFYYEKDENLFSKSWERRHSQKSKIAVYNYSGELEAVFENLTAAAEYIGCSSPSLTSAKRTGKDCKGYFIREFLEGNVPETIPLDFICFIDGIGFLKQIDIVNYLKTSRQTVNGAYKRKSNKILGVEVKWC